MQSQSLQSLNPPAFKCSSRLFQTFLVALQNRQLLFLVDSRCFVPKLLLSKKVDCLNDLKFDFWVLLLELLFKQFEFTIELFIELLGKRQSTFILFEHRFALLLVLQ